MLRELHISNLAVIADATVALGPGLNVFTGQTGAGKSLVIGAFEALLGLRKANDLLRPGADEARITGVFELPDAAVCHAVGRAIDQTLARGDELLVTRKLFASGRTSSSVNGKPVTGAMLAAAAEHLIDIHGQHDHQLLLKPARQLEVLDDFAGLHDERAAYAERYAELRELRGRREALNASATLRAQQLELYSFQADEIDASEPAEGEFAELQARSTVLASVERLKREAGACHEALYEQEGSALERLQHLTAVLLDLAEVDESLAEVTEQVRAATLSLQDAAFELGRYTDRLEYDPQEAAEVEARLNTLNRLVSKYGHQRTAADDSADGMDADADPLSCVLAYRQQIGEQIEALQHEADDLSGLDDAIAAAQREADALARSLTKQRKAAAEKLLPRVEAQLAELGMEQAQLGVQFKAEHADGPSGRDAVEFLARTNPGQATLPLRRIASGGELSRIMLALKSVLSGHGRISVLVFDEVDANIGGRLGSVIGRKLRELAGGHGSGAAQQVLCITHLPQIAAFGNRHLRIIKHVEGVGKNAATATRVERLDGKARITELAEMMAGSEVTPTARKQARELVAEAASV